MPKWKTATRGTSTQRAHFENSAVIKPNSNKSVPIPTLQHRKGLLAIHVPKVWKTRICSFCVHTNIQLRMFDAEAHFQPTSMTLAYPEKK